MFQDFPQLLWANTDVASAWRWLSPIARLGDTTGIKRNHNKTKGPFVAHSAV